MALNNDNKIIKNLRIILLGDAKVGKSTFLMKLIGKKVNKDLEYKPTTGMDYASYQYIFENENFKLDFWDTSGKERYYSLNKMLIKDADALFFFYDSYYFSSFEMAKSLVETYKEDAKKNAIFVLVRSKFDENLKTNHNKNIVSDEEALEFADLNNLYFAHLSIFEKNETGINELLKIALKNYIN